jgi:NAD+ diphosphatase
MHYIYCPQCGAKLTCKSAGDDGYVPYCNKCTQYWFDTFPSCVIVLVAKQYNHSLYIKDEEDFFDIAAILPH